MTFLTQRGEGPGFRYAGQPVHILAGASGRSAGFAAMEITIPVTSPGRFRTHTTNSTRRSMCSAGVACGGPPVPLG
jgi:hypothetical protein